MLSFHLADRSYKSLWQFWFTLPSDYRRKLVYTDYYEAYAAFFRPWQHRPCAKGSGQTSIVEGLNNKWRTRVSGLVRKTVCVQYEDDVQRRLLLVMEKHNQQCRQRVEKESNSL